MKRTDQEFSSEQDEQIKKALTQYAVRLPSEGEMNQTINQLRQYVPAKSRKQSWIRRFDDLIARAAVETGYIGSWFWLASLMLYAFGMASAMVSDISPYATVIVLAPLPVLLGLVEIFKGREAGMWEIELSCRTSPQELLFVRMVLVGFYTIMLNTLTTVLLAAFVPQVSWVKLLIGWLTPFTALSAIALILAARMRSSYVTSMLLAVWMVLTLAFVSTPAVLDRMLAANLFVYIAIIGVGVTVSVWQMMRFLSGYGLIEERNGLFETNYR